MIFSGLGETAVCVTCGSPYFVRTGCPNCGGAAAATISRAGAFPASGADEASPLQKVGTGRRPTRLAPELAGGWGHSTPASLEIGGAA